MSVPETNRHESGFTLIEVLVALVVASLLLAIILNRAVIARDRERIANERRLASLLAENLATTTAVVPIANRAARGDSGRLAWTVAEQEVARDPRGFFILSEVNVRVADQSGQILVELTTRRLKPAIQP